MRIFQISAICLLSAGWLAILMPADGQDSRDNSYRGIVGHNSFDLKRVPAAAAQDAQTSPPEIILNGIMTAFGDKRALFKVEPPQAAGKQSYFLSEGERAGGIELLSVDVKACTIKVSNHGVIQIIALCQPPRLLSIPGTAASAGGGNINLPGNQGFLSGNGQTGQTAGGKTPEAAAGQFSQSGYAGGVGNPGSPATGSSANNNGNTGSQNTGTADTSTANPGTQKAEPFWVRASKEFEQLRTQTADAVRSGVDEPIPLTPLTPAGTPADLIGPDRAWFYDDDGLQTKV
jgi:hypothetical protein